MSDCAQHYLETLSYPMNPDSRLNVRHLGYAKRMNNDIQELDLPCCKLLGYPTCELIQCLLPWKRHRTTEMTEELAMNEWVVIESEDLGRKTIARTSQPKTPLFFPAKRVDIMPVPVTCFHPISTPIPSVGTTISQQCSAELLTNLMQYDIISSDQIL